MKSISALFVVFILSLSRSSGQGLADVLSSIQERYRAVEQAKQVEAHLKQSYGAGGSVSDQELIEWNGLPSSTHFPTDNDIEALGMGQKVALLNQAVVEFRKLQPHYANVSKDYLAVGAEIGAIRPFLPEDFPDLGRADAMNYHALLSALARDVRRLSVLPWPVAGNMETKHYFLDKRERVENGEYGLQLSQPFYEEGSDEVDGWFPPALKAGEVENESWKVANAGWHEMLDEGMFYYALSDTDRTVVDGINFDPHMLIANKYTIYCKEAALFAKVPGRNDQLNGRVGLTFRNEWSPVDMTKVRVTAPHSWDPADSCFEVFLAETNPSSTFPGGGDVSIEIDMDWVLLGTEHKASPYDVWHDGVPFGYDALKQWFLGPAVPTDEAWQTSWEYQEELGPTDIALFGTNITVFRRKLHALCAPEFEKGLDAAGKAANLDQAEVFLSPPAGDGKPVPHPAPGILLGIPVGVGLDGSTSGFVGISPGEEEYCGMSGILYPRYSENELVTRFDYAANLRFIGPSQDFHVVYATTRDATGRGEVLPESGPDEMDTLATGGVSFFDAWDAPRLRQVVSRDLLIDVTPLGHFKTQVKIYRRPIGDGEVDRTPGKLVDVPGGSPIRTLVFENPEAAGDPFTGSFETVRVTDGTTVYNVSRDGFPGLGEGPPPDLAFSMTEGEVERFSKSISFPAEGEATISTLIDGLPVSVEEIGGAEWRWWDGVAPDSVEITAGTQTTTIQNTINSQSPGSQDGRYPDLMEITTTDEPARSYEWMDSGILQSSVNGAWSTEFSIENGTLKAVDKLNSDTLGTTWTEWSDGDRVIHTYSAPDGSFHSKEVTAVALTELELGDAEGTGLPGLPHKLTRKDGSGMVWEWQVAGDGAATVETSDGMVSGGSVSHGDKTITRINKRGYITATEHFLVQGGVELQIAGSETPEGEFTSWGAPIKSADYSTGLVSAVAYDGQRERLASTTDAYGIVSQFSAYDALDRPGSFTWKGHSGSATYNNDGFGVSSSLDVGGRTIGQSRKWDAAGRTTGGSVTSGGVREFTLSHASGSKTLISNNSVTEASSTAIIRTEDGSLEAQTGTTLAFGGIDGTTLTVENGLLKSTAELGELAASYLTTWTDAWGRVTKMETTGTVGGGDLTEFIHSAPAATTKRVEMHHPSGKRQIEETEPWAAGGMIRRSGIDLNQNGSLEAGDRFVTTTTTIDASILRTTVTQTGNAIALVVRDFDPANGIITTTLNGGEDTIIETPDFTARTSEITHKRGGVTVSTKTLTLNQLGQAQNTETSGTGMPATTVNPTFRDDGSVAAVSVTIGGDEASVTFGQDGTLTGATHPLLGNLPVSHGFANGTENLTINGTAGSRSLDGTASSLSGDGVMARSRNTSVVNGSFEHTMDPATGASTTLVANAAGAKVLHQYAVGSNPQTTWLPGGLIESVSRGRGGALTYGYSADGAKDLVSVTWPQVASAGFANEPFYSSAIGITQRDAAGNITRMQDPSGERSLSYQKNRLTTTDWLSGELNAYKVVREHDNHGRNSKVTLYRSDVAIHEIDYGFTGASHELNEVAAAGFTAGISRNAASRHVTGFTRGGVTQSWTRGTAGRITAAASNVTGAPSFTYATFDPKGRRKSVATNRGTWFYDYRGGNNGDGQLVAASNGTLNASLNYTFDGIGRRVDFANNAANALNQFVAIVHPQTPKNLYIAADPTARLWVNGAEMIPFAGGWTYPLGHPGPAGGWIPWTVKGVLEDAGDPGAFEDAVAEFSGNTWFPPTSETFTFDADGNRESSALWHYGWDGRNQLVRARTKTYDTAPEGWDVRFAYDAEGRRYKKDITRYKDGAIAGREVVYFVWDGWDLLYERHEDGNGNPVFDRKYAWGPDIADGAAGGAGGLLMMREKRGTTTKDYYPLFDGTGHVVALTDITGALHAEYWWGPFGELIASSGPKAQSNPWRYQTKYFDEETGLYYFGHRYYDPTTCQFLSRDKMGEDEDLHLYRMTGNDPINYVDRRGLAKVAINEDRSLNAFGLALVAIAKEDPQAARSLLLAAQLEAEISGAGLDDTMGDGRDSDVGATRRALELAVSGAYGDGRDEWLKIGNAAGLGAGGRWWSTELPRSSEVVSDLMTQISPVLAARADAAALARARRHAAGEAHARLVNSPGYKLREIGLATADLPFHFGTALFSGAMMTDITTSSTIGWNGWANGGGFGLGEVSPGERAFAAGMMFIPIGRGGNFVDDFVRAGSPRRLFHYTDSAGAAGIRASGRKLIPGDAAAGKVWATTSTPEQMFGKMAWWHRTKMGAGVNFEFGGPFGIRYTGTRQFTRYFEIDEASSFSRDWLKGPLGQYFKRGEAAVK